MLVTITVRFVYAVIFIQWVGPTCPLRGVITIASLRLGIGFLSVTWNSRVSATQGVLMSTE